MIITIILKSITSSHCGRGGELNGTQTIQFGIEMMVATLATRQFDDLSMYFLGMLVSTFGSATIQRSSLSLCVNGNWMLPFSFNIHPILYHIYI